MADKKITDLQLRSSITDDVNFPGDDGIQTYRMTAAQLFAYIRSQIPGASGEMANIQIVTSVASSALTITLKNQAGVTPTAADPIRIGFRSSTLTSGNFIIRTVTSSPSLVISSGSILGMTSAVAANLYLYAIDNAGTVELAIINGILPDAGALYTTTAEGGAGAADSPNVLYSTSVRTNVAVRLIGRITISEATAGTWASNSTQISVWPFDLPKIIAQMGSTANTSLTSGATQLPFATKISDIYGLWSSPTFTAPWAGWWSFKSNVASVGSWGAGSTYAIGAYKAGTLVSKGSVWLCIGSAAAVEVSSVLSDSLLLAKGDVIDIRVPFTSAVGAVTTQGNLNENRLTIAFEGLP